MTSIESRIDRLESRVEIQALLTQYCKACDDRDVPLLKSLFHEDATMRSADGGLRGEGHDGVMEIYRAHFAALGITVHRPQDSLIRIDAQDPDYATGEVFSDIESVYNGQVMIASARYADEYRRRDGVWRFSARVISFLYYLPVEDYVEGMQSALRQRAYGAPAAADYPEKLDSWAGWTQHFPATA